MFIILGGQEYSFLNEFKAEVFIKSKRFDFLDLSRSHVLGVITIIIIFFFLTYLNGCWV